MKTPKVKKIRRTGLARANVCDRDSRGFSVIELAFRTSHGESQTMLELKKRLETSAKRVVLTMCDFKKQLQQLTTEFSVVRHKTLVVAGGYHTLVTEFRVTCRVKFRPVIDQINYKFLYDFLGEQHWRIM